MQILEEYGFKDDNYSVNDDYYVKRLTYLNELLEKGILSKNESLKIENKQLKLSNRELASDQNKKISKALKNVKNKFISD